MTGANQRCRFDKIQREKRLSPPQRTGNRFWKSSNVFANYPPYTPKRYFGCNLIPGVFALPLQLDKVLFGRLSSRRLSSRAKQEPMRREGSCAVEGPCVCAPRACSSPTCRIPRRILTSSDRFSAARLPLPAFQSPCMLSTRMHSWQQLFVQPRWKRNVYGLGPARSIYFHTNWYQLRRNLRRQLFRGKIISSQHS